MGYQWNRLPEDQHAPLLAAYDASDYVAVLTLLNRYHVAPDILTMCCGLGDAWEQVAEAVRIETLKP
jgi:hypothetical protein